ncbi:LytR family transcriptional attenuator [Stackebrandtia endophytica]|uniref:LytR family transcriptional attenuator n=1 Tax=Stackebrandtia endophytica TaxID=1496996 RepID=A0A543AX78_9ACTN|nr:LCP family protein [Stackebrandtia endophytica]TQL77169.1 LytR family transcriptional attenuator [Stackebrandtia endophytica]
MTDSNRSGSRRSYRATAGVPAGGGTAASGSRSGTTRGGKTYGRGTGRRVPAPGSRAHRFVIVALVLSVLATLGGIGGWGYLNSLNDGLDRLDAFSELNDRPDKVVEGSLNVLVLGSDSRNPDSTEGSRADTIMMMHIPADGAAAYIVSLPRDLWVEVPSNGADWPGGMSKLNSALSHGGLPLMVKTVENYTGVRIDHLIEIDFNGLKAVVDALGGVTMDIEPATGFDTLVSIHKPYREFAAGKQELDGEEALDYVRQRKQFAMGDFARMQHQQDLLMAMMDKATNAGIIGDPNTLTSFLESVINAVRVDEEFDLVSTALQFSNLRGNDLTFVTSPNLGSENINGEDVVVSDGDTAIGMYQAITNDKMSTWVKDNPDAIKGGE